MKRKLKALAFASISFVYISNAQSWKELNDSLEYYYANGEYKKGINAGEKAVIASIKEFGSTDTNYAKTLNNLALLYESILQYGKAEELYVLSLEIFKAGKHTGKYAYTECLNNLAILYQVRGKYEKSEALFVELIETRRGLTGTQNTDYADAVNNLGYLYFNMGRLEKSELLLAEAMKIRKNVLGPAHEDYAASLNNLAVLYQNIGQYEKAEPLFTEAMAIWKKTIGSESPAYSNGLNNLASLFRSMGKYEQAEALYTESLQIKKKTVGTDHPDYASGLNNLGFLYQTTGEYIKAQSLYEEALRIRKKLFGTDHPHYGQSLNNLGAVFERMGEYDKAEPLYTESMNIRKRTLGANHQDYAASLNNLALLYGNMGEYQKAESMLVETNEIQTQNLLTIFNILSEKEKGNYIVRGITLQEANNSIAYYSKKPSWRLIQNNFNHQLFSKSLALSDTRNVIRAVRNHPDTTIQRIFSQWESNKIMLAAQYSLPLAKRRTDLKQLEADTEGMEKELNRQSAAFRNQQKSVRITMKNVRDELPQNEAVIEFVRFRLFNNAKADSIMYAAYVMSGYDSIPKFIPLFEEKQLQKILDSAGTSPTTMVSKLYRGTETRDKSRSTLGREIYRLIWQPLDTCLRGIKKTSYSPAGKLYGIAFHALSMDSVTLLMDKYQLHQYTSTRQVVLRNENKSGPPQSIALFGDPDFSMDSLQLAGTGVTRRSDITVSSSLFFPGTRGSYASSWPGLPGTAEEVEKINRLFSVNKLKTKSYVRTSASEENLKSLSGNSPQVLHIATHGFFLPEPDKKRKGSSFSSDNTYSPANDPLVRSGLILAGGNYAWSGKTPIEGVEDGIATAYEISQLNLSNTELVVLSACETALGDVKGSEGVFGLQRAFKMAGVKKMIVSLWQVPDKETAELMTAFYSYWLKGRTIDEAFAMAQSDMRKKYPPFYWAAFVLVE